MTAPNPDAAVPVLEAIVMATPDDLGEDGYREWCRVATLYPSEGPYAALLLTMPDGPRLTCFTTHVEWARTLLAQFLAGPGRADIDVWRFFGSRPEWPRDWPRT